ncbi:hypothetical protein SAMN04488505_101361 [Chitinophaga rupis]|uniref:Uncharacterized protein n=1 Tax=Chitinophaga rupis TaxID=573321 RepID=A0A1H7HPW0_9BACT|nr:hypothetical protein SAMN04488505_101361 [Chitinophaga rupis]
MGTDITRNIVLLIIDGSFFIMNNNCNTQHFPLDY